MAYSADQLGFNLDAASALAATDVTFVCQGSTVARKATFTQVITLLGGSFLQVANNLSDVTAATARTNLGVGAAHRSFGSSGGVAPTLNATTPPVYFNRAYTCDGLEAACDTAPSGGSATLQLQSSTDGTTYASLGTAISITTGNYSGTQALTSSIAAATWVRGKFTAVNGVINMNVTLYLKG